MTRFKPDSGGDPIELWLEHEVAPAFDRLRADPARALSLAEIRNVLAAEHARAIAKQHPY